MNGALQIKLRSYLHERQVLRAQYHRLQSAESDSDARENLDALYEFDQLSYSHNAIKAYYDVSKRAWSSQDRQPFELFADVMPKIEGKLPLDEMYAEYRELPALRRKMKESAKEGGRIAHQLMNSSVKKDALQAKMAEIEADLGLAPGPVVAGGTPPEAAIRALESSGKSVPESPPKASETVEVSDTPETQRMAAKRMLKEQGPEEPKRKRGRPRNNKVAEKTDGNVESFSHSSETAANARIRNSHIEIHHESPSRGKTAAGANGAPEKQPNSTVRTIPARTVPESGIDTSRDHTNTHQYSGYGHDRSSYVPALSAENQQNAHSTSTRTHQTVNMSNGAPTGAMGPILQSHSQVHMTPPGYSSGLVSQTKPGTGHFPSPVHPLHAPANPSEVHAQYPLTTLGQYGSTKPQVSLPDPAPQKASPSVSQKEAKTNVPSTISPQTKAKTKVAQTTSPKTNPPTSQRSVPESTPPKTSQNIPQNTPTANSKKAYLDTPQKTQNATPLRRVDADRSSFAQFSTWSKDCIRCIVHAAASQPRDPAKAIQSALEERYNIKIREDEAEMLRSHYGLTEKTMDNYNYYIQAFHSVATQFREKKAQYVTVPWADMQIQYERKTRVHLEDWDIKGRYHLFLLHRRVYGKAGEPPNNYQDEVEAYKKKYAYRKSSSFLKNRNIPKERQDEPKERTEIPGQAPKERQEKQETPGTSRAVSVASQSPVEETPSDSSTSDEKPSVSLASEAEQIWTPRVFSSLVEGYKKVTPGTPHLALVLAKFVLLRSGVEVSVEHVIEKMKTSEFLSETSQKTPAEKVPVSTSQEPSSIEITIAEMRRDTRPDSFYHKKITGSQLTRFWDFAKTKCILSTVDFADRIPRDTPVVRLKVVRANLIRYLGLRFLREHGVSIQEEMIKSRIIRMMELDMFDESQCRLLNEVILSKETD